MAERGFRSDAALARAAGIAIPHLSTVLKTGEATLKTINKICSALECQPGDFLRWVPDEDHSVAA